MKGLMIKEFYLLRKTCWIYLAIALVFVAASALGDVFMLFYPAVLAGIIPMNLISYDEKSKWSVYAEVFPYTKKEIVASKYLVVLAYLAFLGVLSTVVQAANAALHPGKFQFQFYLSGVLSLLAVGLIVPGIMLPAIFKLGTEKGSMVYYGVVVIVLLLFGLMGTVTDLNTGYLARERDQMFIPVLLVFGIAAYAVSWMLSVKFYQEREL